jgi:hypothetical protein
MKYDVLRSFLAGKKEPSVRMTFDEVAKAAKTPLPASAFRYPSWWANDPAHHAQARAWVDAGFKAANVDLEAQRVEFIRTETPVRGVREMQTAYHHKKPAVPKVHPAYGALKGTFTVDPSWDLTNPVFDEDEMAEWEASLERKAKLIEEGLRRKK